MPSKGIPGFEEFTPEELKKMAFDDDDTGFVPVDLSNDAYKYGVNYVIYALTH